MSRNRWLTSDVSWSGEKNAGPVSRERPARAVRPRFGSAVCTGCMSSLVPCECSDRIKRVGEYIAQTCECGHARHMHNENVAGCYGGCRCVSFAEAA